MSSTEPRPRPRGGDRFLPRLTMSIRTKLFALAALSLSAAIIVGAIGLYGMRTAQMATTGLVDDALPRFEEGIRGEESVLRVENLLSTFVLWVMMDASEKRIDALQADIEAELKRLRENAERWDLPADVVTAVEGAIVNAFSLTRSNPPMGFRVLRGLDFDLDTLKEVAQDTRQMTRDAATAAGKDAVEAADQAALILVLTGAVVTILTTAATVFVGHALSANLRNLTGVMTRLAKGDTDVAVPKIRTGDEVAAMARTLIVFRDNAAKAADADRLRRELEEAESERAAETARRAEAEATAAHAAKADIERSMADSAAAAEAEAAIGREIAAVIAAAAGGDFTRAIDADGTTGILRETCIGLNAVIAQVRSSTENLQTVLRAMANRDLTRTVDHSAEGVFGRLLDDSNDTVRALAGIVARIAEAAQAVSAETTEMREASADLSQRSEKAASALEHTSVALNQLRVHVQEGADTALEGDDLVTRVKDRSATSRDIAGKAAQAMESIVDSSGRVATITDLLDDVAFQTNLLALNAGVEAARAGEAGRGFAIVAAEVRALAHRTSDAAAEIKTVLEASGRHVAEGVALVTESEDGLSQIEGAVTELSSLMRALAASAKEQNDGIGDIADALTELDEFAQGNVAMQEELTAASHALAVEASNLTGIVGEFRYAEPDTDVSANAA